MPLHKLHPYKDWGLLVLRLTVGIIFLYHGVPKWSFWSGAPEGMPQGMLIVMKILSIAEPLGGAALILGVLTEWAAAGLSIIMIGAIFIKINMMGVGFAEAQTTGWEFDLILLAACINLIFFGSGCFGLDCKACRQKIMGKG